MAKLRKLKPICANCGTDENLKLYRHRGFGHHFYICKNCPTRPDSYSIK